MKHDHSMLTGGDLAVRTESRFVRYFHQIFAYGAQILRLARSRQDPHLRKESSMPDFPEIPTDDEVLAALGASDDGLTPTELMGALEPDHTRDNIIRAIQRVLDRGKVHLTDDAKLVASVVEPAFA